MNEQSEVQEFRVSPLDAVCESLSWSLPKLASAAGEQVGNVYHARKGTGPIPRRVMAFLGKAGFDVGELKQQQDRYRALKQEEAVREARSRCTGGHTAPMKGV